MTEPKPTEDEYPRWLQERFSEELFGDPRHEVICEAEQQQYQNAVDDLVVDFLDSPFWNRFQLLLKNANARSEIKGYPLLAHSEMMPVVKKKWGSVVEKTFRMNVVHNSDWGESDEGQPPDGRWITRNNWFTTIDDLVRTMIVVRYVDGVDIVRDVIAEASAATGLPVPRFCLEARDVGYYALHATVYVPLIRTVTGPRALKEAIPVEIQVCTQVQQVIRQLTHEFYEGRRKIPVNPADQWQWEFDRPEWVPNYLGHLLHYTDGMIVKVRDREMEVNRNGSIDH
jgi:ppGpp synthetase/RelA/SpoT-type nucleotidyltranferase